MRVGLIADTHDNVPMVEKAVALFNREGVSAVFHAGDYVSPFSVKPLLALKCDLTGVWGNNDGDRIALHEASRGRIFPSPRLGFYGEGKILLGHYFETLEALLSSQQFFMIVYGHTHEPEIRREGKTLVINPGECGGWLRGRSTVAIADLETQQGEILDL